MRLFAKNLWENMENEQKFILHSEYTPSGDQPYAIQQLVQGIQQGETYQTLLGVTGSGKTFSIANVIEKVQKPTLIISHNKTLAAQLYGEFKSFFPENMVEFFISYYDYYQPEAYIPSSNTYIEKDLAVNEDIEKLRLRSSTALISGRKDVIIVASVSCIYGIGRPEDYEANIFLAQQDMRISQNVFLDNLVKLFYSRTQADFNRGNFRVNGDTIDLYPAYDDYGIRFIFLGNDLEKIYRFDLSSGKKLENLKEYTVYPANLFVTSRDVLNESIFKIQDELMAQVKYFEKQGMFQEANRIKERTEFDMEMMRELGYCSGIENYSRYLAQRAANSRPYCLLDYFPEDFLLILDESHVTIPQIRGMYHGDRQRKLVLVEHGFRLPSALDNRPLTFDEFESMIPQTIFMTATPAEYELEKSQGIVVEQIVRPTGLLDPPIEVRPCVNQVDDLLEEIDNTVKKGDRVLVTTLTKRMSEELSKYLEGLKIKNRYIHSDVDSLARVDILQELRDGKIDVLVGVNLLREGLDLPEVSLVAILDADKEGFLRSERSLIQTAGRAARNADGRVILYGDKITKSMQKLIETTEYRRRKQQEYNEKHGITPTSVRREKKDIFMDTLGDRHNTYQLETKPVSMVAEEEMEYLSVEQIKAKMTEIKKKMEVAAKDLNFIEAAAYRDELYKFEALLKGKK